MDETGTSGFLARWSRRKVQARTDPQTLLPESAAAPLETSQPVELAPAPASATGTSPEPLPDTLQPPAAEAAVAEQPVLTLDDVAKLTRESDFTRFVSSGVQPEVRNAALKKLFTDPRYNVMDGLDVYIDDYSVPDPLPQSMLVKMVQAKFLGLLQDVAEEKVGELKQLLTDAPDPPAPALAAASPTVEPTDPDEDADLQLQPHDAAGRPGPAPGADPDGGREH
jgi:hypothetical protein